MICGIRPRSTSWETPILAVNVTETKKILTDVRRKIIAEEKKREPEDKF